MYKKYHRLLEEIFLMCYDKCIMELNNEWRDFNNFTGSGVFTSMR